MTQVLEGAWEEIVRQSDQLAGKRVRVMVLEPEGPRPFSETATPEEWARAFREWAESHPPRDAPPLSDEAISRESIYFGPRD